MDFELPAADDPRRIEVRDWLAAHPRPDAAALAAAGYVAPHWPSPWGRGADPTEQLIIDDELSRAGVTRPDNPIALGWAGPTIVAGGTAEQQQRWLPSILDGSAQWCQLFSEPGAGSDLASLRTARDARRRWLRRQRAEDLEHLGRPQRLGHPAGRAPIRRPRRIGGSPISWWTCAARGSRCAPSSR